jgi:hypothetical protein
MESDRSRDEVLREVNRVFDKESLPRWAELRRIGKHRKGEFEITGVRNVMRDVRRYYVIVTFEVIRPDGTTGEYGVRFSRPAAAVLAVVNGFVILVKQHRLPLGKWTTELPRGWIPPEAAADHRATVRAVLAGEIGEEWTASLTPFEPHLVGEMPDDTGYHALVVPVYYLEASTNLPLPKRCGVHQPRAKAWAEVHRLEDVGVINDVHTLAVLRKVERHLAERSTTLG